MRPAGAITHIVDIPAPPHGVYWVLLDQARENNIDSSFEYWHPRDWPPEVGTHSDFGARLGIFSMKGVSRFAEFDPPRRLLIESVKPSWPMSMRMSWDLDHTDAGTLYTFRMEVDAVPGFAWLARLMLRTDDKRMAADVPRLASLF